MHTEYLKRLRTSKGLKEGSSSGKVEETDDERILQFKLALRALVKSMKPEKSSESNGGNVPKDESKGVPPKSSLAENQEISNKGQDHTNESFDPSILKQLNEMENKLEVYLGSEILESDKEIDGAHIMLSEVMSTLQEAKTWSVSTALLQSKNHIVKKLRLASKLRVEGDSPYSKNVEDIALAAAAVVAEWKRMLTQE